MTREVTMEVASIRDAEEMAYNGMVISAEPTESGYLCTFMEEVPTPVELAHIQPEKKFRIYCDTATGRMYLAKKGVTFRLADAKIFPEKGVKTKVYFMNKKGGYNWKYTEA